MQVLDAVGYVACRPSSATATAAAARLHLMRPDMTPRTVCGRYGLDDILPEDEQIPDDTRECGACRHAVNAKGAIPSGLAGRDHVRDGSVRRTVQRVA